MMPLPGTPNRLTLMHQVADIIVFINFFYLDLYTTSAAFLPIFCLKKDLFFFE